MAVERMKEHHGVEINVSAARNITEKHARRAETFIAEVKENKTPCKQMIMELDGEMVPLVEYEECKDRRKKKKNLWAELRIGVAQRFGTVSWTYAASWIVEQGEKVAGSKYKHLIDLFHLCEYFAGAVTAWTIDAGKETKRLKGLFENGHGAKALKELKRRQKKALNHEGLQKCIKYIENRPGQFEYKKAKEKGLPIGSGKVESSHRSLIQKRLKKPGTWWLRENAEKMADLRTLRANGGWKFLWQQDFVLKLNATAA